MGVCNPDDLVEVYIFLMFRVSRSLAVHVVGCVCQSKMAVFCMCVSIASPSLSLLTDEAEGRVSVKVVFGRGK